MPFAIATLVSMSQGTSNSEFPDSLEEIIPLISDRNDIVSNEVHEGELGDLDDGFCEHAQAIAMMRDESEEKLGESHEGKLGDDRLMDHEEKLSESHEEKLGESQEEKLGESHEEKLGDTMGDAATDDGRPLLATHMGIYFRVDRSPRSPRVPASPRVQESQRDPESQRSPESQSPNKFPSFVLNGYLFPIRV